ncbi:MAG: IS110 family transposase, partial [Lentisphaeria bacterium]|nr:IS110 family transposase [Lentisphaeria bacterium]
MLSNLSFTMDRDQHDSRLNVGIDMGKDKWAVDILDTANGKHKGRMYTGTEHLLDVCSKIRELVDLGRPVDVIYEAGRNGFTPARMLQCIGASVTILPVNKLEVVKTGKKAKSDRLDARGLAEKDARAVGFPSVWVPSVDQECDRRMLREIERLRKDIKRNNNRILSIMERWPLPSESSHRTAGQWRAKLKGWRDSELVREFFPEVEMACIENMVVELEVLEKNLDGWEERMDAVLARQREEAAGRGEHHPVDVLMQYKGVGERIARGLTWYVGDFHRFSNGKKFASYLGLVPVPWESGRMRRNQGISKAGNPELRRLMIQLAWLWLRYQPDSAISKKWEARMAGRGRSRKTAIVA